MQIFTFTKVKRISCNVKVNISNPEILSFSFLELILDLCILSMSYEFSYNPSTDKEPYFITYFFYFLYQEYCMYTFWSVYSICKYFVNKYCKNEE